MIHELKVKDIYFKGLIKGVKTFELRKNDRNFNVGDYLALNEICMNKDLPFPSWDEFYYTGQSAMFQIIYMLSDNDYLKDGYVALGIKPCVVTQNYEPQVIDRSIGQVRYLHGKVNRGNCEEV